MRIITDSEYLLNGINKSTKRNKNQDLWRKLWNVMAGRDVVFAKVKAHSNFLGNIGADALAVHGAAHGIGIMVEATPEPKWKLCLDTLAHIYKIRTESLSF